MRERRLKRNQRGDNAPQKQTDMKMTKRITVSLLAAMALIMLMGLAGCWHDDRGRDHDFHDGDHHDEHHDEVR